MVRAVLRARGNGVGRPTDYAAPAAWLRHARPHTWLYPPGDVPRALRAAGLALDWLLEHPRLPWHIFRSLVRDVDGLFIWPERQWLPLAYSVSARKANRSPADR